MFSHKIHTAFTQDSHNFSIDLHENCVKRGWTLYENILYPDFLYHPSYFSLYGQSRLTLSCHVWYANIFNTKESPHS